MLESINSPADLKALSYSELEVLAEEIRQKIIETVEKNGGHLASNLGIVETTLAIHRVFDTTRDAVVFDVGHQCYAHKLITGRAPVFDTLRRDGGISGFTNRDESPYDIFTEGHSGTSLSQALGLSAAFEKCGDDRYVIAVIGDGSFTNGMIYEALNNCKMLGKHLIIILNDNEMSISKNVGGMSHHLTKIRTSKKYFDVKHRLKNRLSNRPTLGSFARRFRDFVRRVLVSDNLFECMGIDYIGPVDGNSLSKMEIILEEAKTKNTCTLVHIHTKKGKGYEAAEKNPERYHSVGAQQAKGVTAPRATFSSVFGKVMEELTENDPRVCAVTAAMGDGTGLSKYSKKFPSNFYDVGIAEEHAVTFSAGLAGGGAKPVAVMYSTFSQRVYDQLWHDVAVQKLSLVLCLDRAGLVEGDGITHQGIFDISELCGIPGINIFSPDSFTELSAILKESINADRLSVIRYPKGGEPLYNRDGFEDFGTSALKHFGAGKDMKITVVTYGRPTAAANDACERAASELCADITLIKLKRIFPIDFTPFCGALEKSDFIYVLEEGIKSGGIGEKLAAASAEKNISARFKIHAVEGFVSHGTLGELFEDYGFTAKAVYSELLSFVKEVKSAEKAEVSNV